MAAPTPTPGPITVAQLQQLPWPTGGGQGSDILYNILLALGGNTASILEVTTNRQNDILMAILNRLLIGGFVPPAAGGTGIGLVSGSATWSGSGLTFDVTACIYYILSVLYYSAPTQVTLAAADPTNSRIDVIYLTNTGTVGVLTGTPAPSPLKPVVNPATQLELTFVLVKAGATTPANIFNDDIYHENVEWTTDAPGDAAVSFVATTAPQDGTKHITSGNNSTHALYFRKGQTLNASNYTALRFYIKVLTPFTQTASQQFQIAFLNSNMIVNGSCFLGPAFGFDSSVAGWQLITVPLSSMVFTSQNFDAVFFKFAFPSVIYLDNIVLQGSGAQSLNSVILTSREGNRFLVEVYQDNDENGNLIGVLATTKL